MNPTLQELIKAAIEARVTDIHVALPGIVQKYDAKKQVADVQPALKKRYADDTVTNLPLISNVPVIMPRNKDAYFHIPLKKDDYVLLIFCERSLDNFIQKGGIVDPEDFRKHHLSDAIAIPGLWPSGNDFPGEADKIDIVNKDSQIRLFEDGKIHLSKKGSTPEEPVVLGKVTKKYLEDIHTKISAILDVLIAGDFVLVTSPGNPTAPNPAKVALLTQLKADLEALKASPISDGKFISDIIFAEKGN